MNKWSLGGFWSESAVGGQRSAVSEATGRLLPPCRHKTATRMGHPAAGESNGAEPKNPDTSHVAPAAVTATPDAATPNNAVILRTGHPRLTWGPKRSGAL